LQEAGGDRLRSYNFYAGIFLAILSLGTCILSYRLGLRNIHNPGPGLVPLAVAVLLGLMSVGLSLRSLFGTIKGFQGKPAFKGVGWRNVLLTLVGLLGYGMAFNFLGFRLCTFFLMVFLLGVVGHQKWWLTLAVSLITVICAYLIFVVWLGSPFPTGPFRI
jgi:putative tricarboxylic transport membrane protein